MHDERLSAILDFNDAVAGRREWDLGSWLYFHGDRCLRPMLTAYADDATDAREYARQAVLAAILIALHHGNRGVRLQRPHRIDASTPFLTHTLLE